MKKLRRHAIKFKCNKFILYQVLFILYNFSPAYSNTSIVADINPTGDSAPSHFAVFQSKLFFSANDGSNGAELWVYDGVNLPRIKAHINTQPYSPYPEAIPTGASSPSYLTVFNSKLYFSANDGIHGFELWVYDGVNPPTMVADINPDKFVVHEDPRGGTLIYGCSYPVDLTVFNSKLYFSADDGTTGRELWVYDGINPPSMVADINPSGYSSNPSWLTVFNSKLFFTSAGTNINNEQELWVYDGIDPSTLVADILPGQYGSDPRNLIVFNSKLYFFAHYNIPDPMALFAYDGVNPAYIIENNSNPYYYIQYYGNITIFNDNLYFSAYDINNGTELRKFDGINPSSVLDILPGDEGSSPTNLYSINSALLFSAFDATHGQELWGFDGISKPTMIADINPSGDSNPSSLIEFKSKVYFSANDGTKGKELWAYQPPSPSSVITPILELLLMNK